MDATTPIAPETLTATRAGQERLRALGVVPHPEPDDTTRPYWDAARRHQLVLLRCEDCLRYRHPPHASCLGCGSQRASWQPVSGLGTVYSFIVDHRNMVPGFDGPYVVALVVPDGTDGQVRLATHIVGCPPHAVEIGLRVEVEFHQDRSGYVLPRFRPADDGRSRAEEAS